MTKRILIVDDDIAITESLTYFFEDAGYVVETCRDGGFVYKKFNGGKPDIILLDYLLPGENGEDITKKLKSKRDTKNIPIIIMSASHNIKNHAAKAGADAFIPKPYDVYDLMHIVKTHLTK